MCHASKIQCTCAVLVLLLCLGSTYTLYSQVCTTACFQIHMGDGVTAPMDYLNINPCCISLPGF